jgi:hypothetical protein
LFPGRMNVTALRGATALRHRAQREARNKAAVALYEKARTDVSCKEGPLLKRNHKGALRWKQVAVYVNKKSQVIAKLKSNHIGGVFSKKKKSVVYGVHDGDLPHEGGDGTTGSAAYHFGLRTAQGLLVFHCESRTQRQDWVEAVKNLIRQVSGATAQLEHSFEALRP